MAWLLMLVLILSLSPLSGCAHLKKREPKPQESLPLFEVPPSESIKSEPIPASSPYHPLPTPSMPPVPAPAKPPAAVAPEPASTTPSGTIRQVSQQYPLLPPVDTPPTAAPQLPPDPPVVRALRCLYQKQGADAVLALEPCSPASRELLMRLLTVVTSLSAPEAEKPDSKQTTVTVQVLERCADDLRRSAQLVLEKVCFCQWIDKFGVYEPLPEGHAFLPGSQVHVYVELRNFASEPCAPCYETRLASRVKILDSQGKVVPGCEWCFNDRNRPERCRSLRHDYFINYSLPLPRTLPPGRYRLLLHIDDLLTKRSAERPLDLILTTRPLAAN